MSQKLFKKIRKYAKLRNLDYSRCKTVYDMSTPEEQALFRKEMDAAIAEPVRPTPYHAVLPIKPSG